MSKHGGTSFLTYIVYFLLALFAVIFLWLKQRQNYWKRRGIFSPQAHWLFGNFKDAILLRRSVQTVLTDLYRSNDKDKVIGIYIMHKPFLLLKDAELVKSVMIKDFDIFPNRNFSLRSKTDMSTYNLFSAEKTQWKHLRVKMSPVFTTGKIKKLFDLMVETSDTMKDFVQKKFDSSYKSSTVTFDAKDAFMKFSTDVISSVAFGVRSNSFDENSEFYRQSRVGFKPSLRTTFTMFVAFFFPELTKLTSFKSMGEGREYFGRLFWDTFNEREKSGKKRGDLIDYLIELKNGVQDDEFRFEGDVLLGQSLIFFIAGRETSTTTMCFALAELAKQPVLQDRVRKEIREALKSDGFTYDAVQKMKYLNQVISETLRLYPPAPMLDRVASQDYKIPGSNLTIEKGTPVFALLTGMHMNPEYFPDPTRFDPDRFSDERKNDILPYTFMPFGDGPRICIGMRVGLLQVAVGLITILNNYEVSLNLTANYNPHPRNIFLTPGENFLLDLQKLPADD